MRVDDVFIVVLYLHLMYFVAQLPRNKVVKCSSFFCYVSSYVQHVQYIAIAN